MLREILDQEMITCEPDAKVSEVAKIMADRDVGSVLVLDNGKPRGLITDRDIVLRCIAKNVDVNDCTVENVMTEPLESVNDTDGIYDVIKKMENAGVRRIPVVNSEGKAVGIVTFTDLVTVLGKELFAITRKMSHPKVGRIKGEEKLAA